MTTADTDSGAIDAATAASGSGAGTSDTVAARLQTLENMDYPALRAEWRRLYRAHPPKRVSRDLLMLGVAWKVQERCARRIPIMSTNRPYFVRC